MAKASQLEQTIEAETRALFHKIDGQLQKIRSFDPESSEPQSLLQWYHTIVCDIVFHIWTILLQSNPDYVPLRLASLVVRVANMKLKCQLPSTFLRKDIVRKQTDAAKTHEIRQTLSGTITAMTHNPNIKSEHGGFAFVIQDHLSNKPWIHSELATTWLSRYNEMKWQQTGKCSINKLNGVSAWKDMGVGVNKALFLLLNHWVPMPVRQLDPMAVATWTIANLLPEQLRLRVTNDVLPNLFHNTPSNNMQSKFDDIRQNISIEFRKTDVELPLGIKLYDVTTRDTHPDSKDNEGHDSDSNDDTNDSVRSVRINASA